MPDHTVLDPIRSSLLTTQGTPVPLLGVDVGGEVFGAQARVVVRQRYRNAETRPIEAVYTFPLPSDGVLVGFAMECNGRRMIGEVKEREAAFQAYDDAVVQGHGAALLDQERRNVFTANVGNLLPGEETIVEVTYVQRLGADEGALRLSIPTVVAPRYMPGTPSGDRSGHGTQAPTDRVPDADRISPAIGAVRYGLSLGLVFDLGREVTVESPSHAVVVEALDGHRRRISFRSETVALDRDVVLLAAGAPGVAAGIVAERGSGDDGQPGDGTFALTVVPDLGGEGTRAPARDVAFVVDVSGSMSGTSIEQAKSALRLCLRHLAEGDRFQVIAFSTSFYLFQPHLVPFTQRTLEEADRWVQSLQAHGGTEMLQPLEAALAAFDKPARDRVIVLLTDGQVGNEAEIVERIAGGAAGARVYGFGIGTAPSDLLLSDLARRTRGAAEMIHPGERIDDKVTAQFARATAPRIEELTVRFIDVDAGELAPAELPSLVDGEPWVVYGRYGQAGHGRVEIRGQRNGERFFLEVPVHLPARAERPGLAALWAAARIRDLEESERKLDGRRAEAQKKRIVALSVEHGVASKYASFIVVERRSGDRRAHGMPETRAVPVHAPAGWAAPQAGAEGARMRSAQVFSKAKGLAQAPAPMAARRSVSLGAPSPPMAARAFSYGAPPPAPGPMPPSSAGHMSPPGAVPGGGGVGAPPAPRSVPMSPQPPPRMAPPSTSTADRDEDDGISTMVRSPAPEALEERAQRPKQERGDPATVLFQHQLASGLWGGDGREDADRMEATAKALAAAFAAGIDTAHAIYGAQLKKAVQAVCDLAQRMLSLGGHERVVTAGLSAAFLVAASSRRLRAQVLDVARASSSAPVRELASQLTDARAAQAKLVSLGAG